MAYSFLTDWDSFWFWLLTINSLESEVKKPKDDIEHITNNMSEIMIKIITLEEKDKHYYSMHLNETGVIKEGLRNIAMSSKGTFYCEQCSHSSDTNSALPTHIEIEQ